MAFHSGAVGAESADADEGVDDGDAAEGVNVGALPVSAKSSRRGRFVPHISILAPFVAIRHPQCDFRLHRGLAEHAVSSADFEPPSSARPATVVMEPPMYCYSVAYVALLLRLAFCFQTVSWISVPPIRLSASFHLRPSAYLHHLTSPIITSHHQPRDTGHCRHELQPKRLCRKDCPCCHRRGRLCVKCCFKKC